MDDTESTNFGLSDENEYVFQEKPKSKRSWWLLLILLGLLFGLVIFAFINGAPRNFPTNTSITIERGGSAATIASYLDEQNVVRSETWLYFLITAFHDPSSLKAGTYVFSEPLSAWSVASRLTEVAPPDTLINLTLPEGYTIEEFGSIAEGTLSNFDAEIFVSLTENQEGYLFPDTYFVPHDFSEQELADLLQNTYQQKISEISDSFSQSDLSEYDVLTLASIVEREANTLESMAIVAGILLDRLRIGMALQADASMEYALDKPLNELTADDLEIDSPYNTYLYPGLPPTPIGNPGLQSITAVLHPTTTPYLYYITDEDGEFHYAETFEEHKRNIERYLR